MRRVQNLLLPAILVLSAALNIWHNGFPLGYHIDEPVKVASIKDGTQNFNHPILMLQLARVTNLISGFSADQAVVVLGRTIQALCATATVFVSFLLARRVLGRVGALVVAASVAVSPTLVVHAHYLKEDTLLTLWLITSLLAFVGFLERPSWRATVWLGLASGLAVSSHYKAALLAPLFAAAPLLGALRSGQPPRGGRPAALFSRDLLAAGLVAAAVFLVVNWPLFLDVPGFLAGAGFEARHAVEGEDARVRPTDFWLGFHLLYSLAPGMTWPALMLGLGGLAGILVRWRRETLEGRLLATYLVVFYLVPEISPLRPAPDFARYVMPVVPILIYLAWRAATAVANTLRGAGARLVTATALVALVLVPLYSTVRLTSSMGHDTRARAAEWLAQRGGTAIVERYAGLTPNVWTASDVDLTRARTDGVDYVVTSSFMFGRYALGSQLPGQDEEIYRRHRRYQELFAHPYVEIAPAYRSFGFSNPLIRIVNLAASKDSIGPGTQ